MPKTNLRSTHNPRLFRTPFSKDYWMCAFGELRDPKMLTLAALFIALRMVIKTLKIPVNDTMNVYFTFAINALGSYIYGPAVGFVSGAACDTISFLIKPSGPYNPAFMLIEALGSFLYGIFLYRSRVSIVRLFLSKFSVSLICNIFLTPLFLSLMYGNKSLSALMASRILKNAIMLPIETAVLAVLFAVMLPMLHRVKAVPWISSSDEMISVGAFGY